MVKLIKNPKKFGRTGIIVIALAYAFAAMVPYLFPEKNPIAGEAHGIMTEKNFVEVRKGLSHFDFKLDNSSYSFYIRPSWENDYIDVKGFDELFNVGDTLSVIYDSLDFWNSTDIGMVYSIVYRGEELVLANQTSKSDVAGGIILMGTCSVTFMLLLFFLLEKYKKRRDILMENSPQDQSEKVRKALEVYESKHDDLPTKPNGQSYAEQITVDDIEMVYSNEAVRSESSFFSYSDRLRYRNTADDLEITIPRKLSKTWLGVAVILTLIGLVSLILNSFLNIFYLFMIFAGIRMLLYFLTGKEILILKRQQLIIKRGDLLGLKTKSYEIADIKKIRFQNDLLELRQSNERRFLKGNYISGEGFGAICFNYGIQTISFGEDIDTDEVIFILKTLSSKGLPVEGLKMKKPYEEVSENQFSKTISVNDDIAPTKLILSVPFFNWRLAIPILMLQVLFIFVFRTPKIGLIVLFFIVMMLIINYFSMNYGSQIEFDHSNMYITSSNRYQVIPLSSIHLIEQKGNKKNGKEQIWKIYYSDERGNDQSLRRMINGEFILSFKNMIMEKNPDLEIKW